MYCKHKMYDLLQRRCIRGCGFVGVASSPGNVSGEVGNYVNGTCMHVGTSFMIKKFLVCVQEWLTTAPLA